MKQNSLPSGCYRRTAILGETKRTVQKGFLLVYHFILILHARIDRNNDVAESPFVIAREDAE